MSCMSDKVLFLDTNALVYLFDFDEPEKKTNSPPTFILFPPLIAERRKPSGLRRPSDLSPLHSPLRLYLKVTRICTSPRPDPSGSSALPITVPGSGASLRIACPAVGELTSRSPGWTAP